MSYRVLYRKYRPSSFSEIIGQKVVVDMLKKSIIEDKISHAYIFTGPRGTGKTSTAKILAKTLNCTNVKDGEACGKCQNCLSFENSPDIIEIDAASNNGVDEIRELRNNVNLAPAESKYKVYIIDEVHMLSTGAFNALLKTLEEPPSHVVFILATTEIYKVPVTILSRCQRLDFKKIDKKDMIEHLEMVCSKENIKYTPDSLDEIYHLSDGCMRDALSILDQISKVNNEITLDLLLKNYDIISDKEIKDLVDATFANDITKVISKIEKFEDSGANAQKIIKKIIDYLERIAVDIKLGKNKEYEFNKIKRLIISLNECYVDARINENIYSMIKLSFLDLMGSSNLEKKPAESQVNKTKEPKRIEQNNVTSSTKKLDLASIRVNNCFCNANKEALISFRNVWPKLDAEKIDTLNLKNYSPVAASLSNIVFTAEDKSLTELFNIKKEDIEKYLTELDLKVKVIAITNDEWNKAKAEYVDKLKKGEKYSYIEEPKEINDNSKIKQKADEIFEENIVEVN